MKKIRFFFSAVAFLLFALTTLAQNTVSGVVSDGASGETLVGAAVMVKGTRIGAVTDASGAYSINVPNKETAVLVVSYYGFKTRDIPVAGHNIVLRKELPYNALPLASSFSGYHDQTLRFLVSYMERIGCLPEPLTLHRRHERNESSMAGPAKAVEKYDPCDGNIHERKLTEFAGRIRSLREFLQSRLQGDYEKMSQNKKILEQVLRFFEKRAALLHYSPIFRPFRLSFRDFLCYFIYCKGFRTLAHDLICRKIL